MKIAGKPYRTIWLADDGWRVRVIDQGRLPFEFTTVDLGSLEEAADAIRSMVVRGAPLIGATAAVAIAVGLQSWTLHPAYPALYRNTFAEWMSPGRLIYPHDELYDARVREAEERKIAEEEAQIRKTREEAERLEREAAEARKAEEEKRRKQELEAKAKAEQEAKKRFGEESAPAAARPGARPVLEPEEEEAPRSRRGSARAAPQPKPARVTVQKNRARLTVVTALNADEERERSVASFRRRVQRLKGQAALPVDSRGRHLIMRDLALCCPAIPSAIPRPTPPFAAPAAGRVSHSHAAQRELDRARVLGPRPRRGAATAGHP